MRSLVMALALFGASHAVAQEQQPLTPTVQSSVLTINTEELFAGTEYGQRVLAELEVATVQLQAENSRIVADLLAEERALTQQRPEMDAASFRAAAAAFDAKAEAFRAERDGAAETLRQQRAVARGEFLRRTHPIVGRVMLQRGASVVLDRSRSLVFISIGAVDITADAIAAINETLGDGSRTREQPDIAGDIAPEIVPHEDLSPSAENE